MRFCGCGSGGGGGAGFGELGRDFGGARHGLAALHAELAFRELELGLLKREDLVDTLSILDGC